MYALNWRPAIEAVNPISAYAAVVKCASDAVMYLCVVEATAFGRLDRRPECGDVPKAVLRTNRERHSDGNGREEDEQAASLVGHVAVSLKLTRIRYLIPRHEAERPRPIWKGPDYPTSSGGPFMRMKGEGVRGICMACFELTSRMNDPCCSLKVPLAPLALSNVCRGVRFRIRQGVAWGAAAA